MLNLNDLRTFVQVVQWNGFAAASRALRVPKSTLSKRVAELERSLDATLVHRSSRSFVVTALGSELHHRVLGMLTLAEDAEQLVRGQRAEPTGIVSLTCSVPTAQYWLAPLLPPLAKRLPKVLLHVHASDRFVDLVRDGFDLALRDHAAPLTDSALIQRKLFVDPIWLVAAPRYLARRGVPRTPEQLVAHDGLLATVGAAWRLAQGLERRELMPNPRLVTDETTMLLEAATAGLGIAAIPRQLCASRLAARSLRRVLPAWEAGRITTTLLMHERRSLLPSVRAVVDALVRAAAAPA